MAIPPQNPFQFQQVNPAASASYQEPVMKTAPPSTHITNTNITATIDPALASNNNNSSGSKKQKTTPPCDRCRQRRIKCDRLEPICSSCIKYKAPCQRTAIPAGHPLSLVSMDAVGSPGLRIMTNAGKRDRHFTETEILDSCLRDVQSLQLNRLRRIEQFFDRVGIEENRLEEIGWLSEQIKVQHESTHGTHPDLNYRPEEVVDKLGHRASLSWIKQLLPLLQATKGIQQVPSTAHLYSKSAAPPPQTDTALQATLTEDGAFTCPAPRPMPFPSRVSLSVLNKTMFELSVYDCTEYLGPVAGTKASSWSEEMRFPLPWLVPEPQVKDSLLALPPLELMLELIEWMIQSPLYVYFPILTKASIMNALTAAIPGPDAPSLGIEKPLASPSVADSGALPQRITGRVSAIFLLNAIMALGAAYRSNAIKEKKEHRLLDNKNIQDLPEHDFQTYFDRSQALTAYILAQPRVSSLQGLLLLMKCPTIPGIQNLYREQACAMALALGLHRDCEPWTLCRSVTQLRRNIFWCCYVIDASYSLNSGSPERFPDDYISIGLPKLPSLELGDDIGELEFEGETNRIGFLIEQAKLWKIVKKIRRCGQTSHNSEDGYREGSNLYRAAENQIPAVPSMTGMSPAPQYGFLGNTTTGQSPYSPYSAQGTPKTPISVSASQPAWVWRADSARRILDVELARWQMDLPSHLRFDFALTRKDDPCPHAVRRNGLGAMLQLIFNEVLILLHHPFLALADSQGLSKRDQSSQPPSRNSKSRSSTSSIKSPRSRRSSSTSRSHSISMPNSSSLSDDGIVRPTKPAPPFLNSCTKAAEAITFLIEHLLRTTPEWLACHNGADSAIHIAERVHALNVSLAAKNVSLGTPLTTGSANHVSSMQAKSQYRRTRAFRKTVADLDKFTMPNDYRPELLTQELIVLGTARDRLVRSMKHMLQHRVGDLYYRLPRSAPELDSQSEGEGSEQDQSATAAGTGHDFLDLKLAYMDERVWIRFYNTRIQDHIETKNGSETWQEILHPFSPTPELELDDEGEEEMEHQHPFGFSMMEELSLPIYEVDEAEDGESNKQRAPRQRFNSRGEVTSETTEDTMDPPQVSTETFLEIFSINTPSAEICSGIMGGSPSLYLGGQQNFTHQKDGSNGGIDPTYDQSYYKGYDSPQVSLDNFDPSMVLDGSPHSRAHSSGADQSSRGYYNMGAFLHQNRPAQSQSQYPQEVFQPSPNQHQHQHQHHRHHHNHPQPLRQQNTHPLQQDPNGPFPNFDLHTGAQIMGFDPSTSSPSSFSAPDSPNQPPPLENNLGLGLVSVSAPLSLQQQMAIDGGHYLNLVSQQFPNQHIPTQPQGPIDSYQQQQHQQQQQQQSLDPALSSTAGGSNPIVRPFYGMPMGGFMTPGLDSLPVINRTTQATSFFGSSSTTNGYSSAVGQALSSPPSGWSLEAGTANAVASYLAKSEPHSPALPPSLVSSVPTSPIPMHQSSFRLMLSPTTESIQGISNRMNAWDGINGPKVVDESDLQGPSLMEYSSSTVYHHQQQTHHHQHQHHHHQHANGSLLEAPAAGGSTSQFGSSWSSASSSSELTTTSTTTGTTTTSNSAAGTSSSSSSSTRMDGIEAGPSSKSSSSSVSISAVPETSFGDYGERKMSVVDERGVGIGSEGDKESAVLHGRSFNPLRSASISGRSR